MVMLSQPRANVEANDIKPSEQDIEIFKAWNDVWLGFEPLLHEMQKAGWIDANRVKSTYDQIRKETGLPAS